MKFAFLIMGDFDHRQDRSSIHQGMAQMIGVASIEEACEVARGLVAEGVDFMEAIHLYGSDSSKRMFFIEYNLEHPEEFTCCISVPPASKGEHVVHLPEQNELFETLFG